MPITAAFRVPPISVADRPDKILLLPNITWNRTVEGGPLDAVPDPTLVNVPEGTVSGTYGGADSFTGIVRSSPFLAPPNRCVVVPLLTGPRAEGLSARLEDARTGATVEPLPVRDNRNGWHYWKVQIGPEVKTIRIVIEDAGRNWGEWLATATPYACPNR
jgi:hypothetical protein